MGADRSCPRSRWYQGKCTSGPLTSPSPRGAGTEDVRGLGNALPDSQLWRQLQVSRLSVLGLTEGASARYTDLDDPLKLGDPIILDLRATGRPREKAATTGRYLDAVGSASLGSIRPVFSRELGKALL